MKINLKGPDLQRYREIRKAKQRFQMPDKRTMTQELKIVPPAIWEIFGSNLCCLTPRQQTKLMEMNAET